MSTKKQEKQYLVWTMRIIAVVLCMMGLLALWEPDLYPFERGIYLFGDGPEPLVDAGEALSSVSEADEDDPKVLPNATWKVNVAYRLSACDNRPGLKKIYVRVLDEKGEGIGDVRVGFGGATGKGMAFDHPDIWGLTKEEGHLYWDHWGKPTVYSLHMGDDAEPLVTNMRTDGGNEYCRPGSAYPWDPRGWRPVNRPGVFSFRVEIQRKAQ